MIAFIHGWSFSSSIWDSLYKGKFYNLPYHYRNENEYPQGKIIDSFVDEVGNSLEEGSTLVGWSLGASVCVLTALRYPKKVKKLILVGFSPKFKDENLGSSPKFVKAFMLSLKKDFEKTIYNFRKTSSEDYFKDIPLPEKEGGTAILKEFIDLDLTKEIENLSQEVVLIHGKKDKIVNYNAGIFANEKIKNSKLILTDDNHSPFIKNPDIIVNHL